MKNMRALLRYLMFALCGMRQRGDYRAAAQGAIVQMDTLYVRLRPEWVWLCCTARHVVSRWSVRGLLAVPRDPGGGVPRASHGLVSFPIRANPVNGDSGFHAH